MALIDTAKESLAFWRAAGAEDHHCWALLANEDGETSFKPRPVGDHGEAFGIFQWHAVRADALAAAPPKGCGIDIRTASHIDQLRAAHFEMTSVAGYWHVWSHLLATTTIQDAVTVLVREYEHSSLQARDIARRTALALAWQEKLGTADA